MKVYLGADHRGFKLKEEIKEWLQNRDDCSLIDLGNTEYNDVDDYPDYSIPVAEAVVADEGDQLNLASETSPKGSKGIVFCGSGVGVTIAANKVTGARAAAPTSLAEVKAARQDDDLNVLAIGADFVTLSQAQDLINAFLITDFDPSPKHMRRLNKIRKYETHD